MKIEVPITRSVEVHAHNFSIAVRYSKTTIQKPTYSLVCMCGNGFVFEPELRNEHDGPQQDDYLNVAKMLEMAAGEQERRHSDW